MTTVEVTAAVEVLNITAVEQEVQEKNEKDNYGVIGDTKQETAEQGATAEQETADRHDDVKSVALFPGQEEGTIAFYLNGAYVFDRLNMAYIEKITDDKNRDEVMAWILNLTKETMCLACGGAHNIMVCPKDNCWNCGEPGHWDFICRNGCTERLSKEDFWREVRSYKSVDVPDNDDDNDDVSEEEPLTPVSDAGTNDSYG